MANSVGSFSVRRSRVRAAEAEGVTNDLGATLLGPDTDSALPNWKGAPTAAAGSEDVNRDGDIAMVDRKRGLSVAAPQRSELGGGNEKDERVNDIVPVPPLTMFRFATRRDKFNIGMGLLFSLLSGSTPPCVMLLMGEAIDKLNADKEDIKPEVAMVSIAFTCVAVVAFIAAFFQVLFWTKAGDELALRIRILYVGAVLRQDTAWFDEHHASRLSTSVTADMALIQDGIGRKLGDAFQYVMGFILLIAVAFYRSPEIAAVVIVFLPIIAGATAVTNKLMSRSNQQSSVFYAKAGGVATEAIGGIRTVASLACEPTEIERYSEHLHGAEQSAIKTGWLTGLGQGVGYCCFFGMYGVAFCVGGIIIANDLRKDCQHNCVTGGAILTAIFATLVGGIQIGQAATGMAAFAEARRAAVSVFATIDRVPDIDCMTDAGKKMAKVDGNIHFEDVTFAYPARPDTIVFRNLQLRIAAGTTCALVGSSGGGKSTLARLLLRFYDPLSGAVRLDGIDIRQLNLKWLRSKIGYVGQEPVLFDGTIRENIANGKVGCTEEEVRSATKKANAFNFITSFPNGFDVKVGEGGIQLSGGQKQRIAIARAIIRDPTILILDESTSALDSQSERVVQAALDALRHNSRYTTLVIAHRLSTIKEAETIAFIADKCVAEQGTHQSLMAMGGLYAGLCQTWESDASEAQQEQNSGSNSVDGGEETKEGGEYDVDSGFVDFASEKGGGAAALQHGGKENVKHKTGKKADEITEEDTARVPSLRLWAMNQPERPQILIGWIGAVLVGACFPLEGVLLAQGESAFYKTDPHEVQAAAQSFSLWFILLAAMALTGYVLLNYGMAVAGEKLTHRLRDQCLTAIVRHDIGWFDREEHSTGVLTTQLESDAGKVQKATGKNIAHKLQLVCCLGVGICIALVACWEVALITLACIPFMSLNAILQMKSQKGMSGDEEGLDGGNAAERLLGNALNSMSTVSAYNMQGSLAAEYGELVKQTSEERKQRAFTDALGNGYSRTMNPLLMAFLFWIGGEFISNGTASFADFFTAMFAIFCGCYGVGQISGEWGDQQDGMDAAARLFKRIDEPLKIDPLSEQGSVLPGSSASMNIKFQDITFAYPQRPDTQIFSKMSLEVKAGSTVALCGPSGCGKSTCLSLLLRFYNPLGGAVLLNGRDVRELNLRWLRMQVGYVGQEPVLFSGSIEDNIRRGQPSATQQEVENAARSAHAHDFILSFPTRYETEVGDKSAFLSGGQKQRIAIARALVKRPGILLLDEASSALDNESEKQVQAALTALQSERGRTTMVVAHKLSTITNADAIAVFDNGVVSELGTHNELLAIAGGAYAELWRIQNLQI